MSTRPGMVLALTVVAAMATAGWAAEGGVAPTSEQERMGIDPQEVVPDGPAALAERRATVEATLIVQEGDTPPGAPSGVSNLNAPFTDGAGSVGLLGDESANDDFIWYDTGIVWSNSDAVGVTLTGGESTMGVGQGGAFIYSPSIDGDDGVWTDQGQLAVENTQAPGFPAGHNSTFHSRPTMITGGQAYWVSGHNNGDGTTTTRVRIFYTSTDGTPATIAPVRTGGTMIDGQTIEDTGIDFDYDVSDDGSHVLLTLDLATGSSDTDAAISLDDTIVAQEGSPNGSGDNWDNFDQLSVNNDGHYLISGDTDGDTGSDEFIAYDGTIAVREGDVVDGVTLTSSASVRFAALNNLGQVLHAWEDGSDVEHVFFACDASDLAATSTLVLSTGDQLDLDGNGTGDTTVTDLETGFHNQTLDDSGPLFLLVSVDDGGGEVEALISIERPSCAAGGLVINEIDYDQPGTDSAEFIELYNGSVSTIDLGGYALELVNGANSTVYNTIDLPSVDLGPGEFYVVCGDAVNVPNCDLDVSPDGNLVQNGSPDAVALVLQPATDGAPQPIVDTVSYEGSVPGYVEGSGDGLEDDSSVDYFSISRTTDGLDTDQNNVDFAGRCNSPGVANLATTSGCVLIPVELMTFTVD